MTTIKDVAKYANVSIGTISNYLNGKPVRAKNSEKIKEAIEVLNYKTNSFGKFLRTRETKTIGVITFNIATSFVSEVFTIFERQLYEKGYDVYFCNSHGDVETEKQKIDFMISRGIDALVIFPCSNTLSDPSAATELNLPVLTIDNTIKGNSCSAITFDDTAAAYNATKHMIVNGHKKIACLSGPNDYHTTIKRIEGYQKALQDYSINDFHIIKDINSPEQCKLNCIDYMCHHPDISAFLVTSSSILISFLDAMQSLSIKVPDDISYITFDDKDYFNLLATKPTYVYQDKRLLAHQISEVISALLANPQQCIRKEIKTHLILGDSVKNRSQNNYHLSKM